MAFSCFGGGCLGSWSALALWAQAESLWETDMTRDGVGDEPLDGPYWPGTLDAPW
jgi:hypothetical protein